MEYFGYQVLTWLLGELVSHSTESLQVIHSKQDLLNTLTKHLVVPGLGIPFKMLTKTTFFFFLYSRKKPTKNHSYMSKLTIKQIFYSFFQKKKKFIITIPDLGICTFLEHQTCKTSFDTLKTHDFVIYLCKICLRLNT